MFLSETKFQSCRTVASTIYLRGSTGAVYTFIMLMVSRGHEELSISRLAMNQAFQHSSQFRGHPDLEATQG